MSSDPKKPFDAPPSEPPSILNKELNLDRRNRQVPSFEELAAGRAPAPAKPQVPPNLTPRNRPAFDVDDDPDPVTRVGGPNAALLAKAAAAPAADDNDEPITRVGSPNQALLKRATVSGSQPALAEPVTAPVGVQRVAPAAGAKPPGAVPQPQPPARTSQPAPARPAAAAPRPAAAPARAAVPAPAVTAPGGGPRGAAPAPAPRPTGPEGATQRLSGPAITAPGPAPRAAAPASPLAAMPRVAAPGELSRPWEPSDALTIAASGGPPRRDAAAGAPAPRRDDDTTGVLGPRRDDEATGVLAPRRAPPSPAEFAQQQALAAAAPRVTPSPATYSAAPGPDQAPPRAAAVAPATAWDDTDDPRTEPARRVEPPRAPPPSYADEPEVITAPARRSELPLPALPVPAPAPTPASLPPALLTTQPGIPGPFARPPAGEAAFVPSPGDAAAPAPVEELGVPPEELPSFGDTSLRAALRSDTVTAAPAALWRRVGAWLVDLVVVVGLVTGFLAAAVQVIAPGKAALPQQLLAVALPGAALAALLAFVYAALFAFLWRGRTPGRRLMGIHLVDTTGHAPGPLRALVRAGLSLVSFGLFLSGFWLALFDRHGQTLHDKLTRTFVVRLQDA